LASGVSATPYTDQSAFNAAALAVGTLATETFDSYATGQQISSLPTLGIAFDPLAGSGTYPVAWPVLDCGGGIASSPNALLNSSACGIPPGGQGDIVFRPIDFPYGVIGVGFYNASTDDSLLLSFYDGADQLIESLSVPGGPPAFIGIVTTAAAAKFTIHAFGANGLFALDNLQVAIALRTDVAVPEPGTLAAVLIGLAGLASTRRRRHRRRSARLVG
ncbi:MAG: PEP-CTERM sorting domain-containing protein, partial [Rhodospirillaceae bacterium]|nr:PEP-CTERM sorting domain-containing protein [Rhodospirillaceae bacterium]